MQKLFVALFVSLICVICLSAQVPGADSVKSATLKVIKHVINDDGGTAKPSDFTITVDHSSDVSVSPYSFQGSEDGTMVTLTGTFNQLAHFTVHEGGIIDGYEVSYSSNCHTLINAGELLPCVITNNDKPTTSASQTNKQSTGPANFDLSVTHPTVNIEQGAGTYSNSVLSIDSTIRIPTSVKVEVSVDLPGLGVTARDEGYSTVEDPGTLQVQLLDGKFSLDDLLYVDGDPYTPPGTYLVNVKVSMDLGDGMITKTVTLTVNVTPPKTFSVSVTPNEVTVVQGGSVNTDVTVTSNEPHQYGLFLWVGNGADLHSGLKFTFPNLPNPVSEGPYSHGAMGTPVPAVPGNPVTTTLTITASNNTSLGKHTIWVNAHGQVLDNDIAPDTYRNSNMYVPVIVNVVAPPSTTNPSTTTPASNEKSQVSNILIPSWIKHNALYWSEGQTSDHEYALSIGWLITNRIINLQSSGGQGSSIDVSQNIHLPTWIKNNANWWAKSSIDDSTYLMSLQYMLDTNIITFTKLSSVTSQITRPTLPNASTQVTPIAPQDSVVVETAKLVLPQKIIQEATSSSGATVSYDVSATYSLSGAVTPTCDHQSGTVFPIGSTIVTCKATNPQGKNPIQKSFPVIIQDTTPPAIDPFEPHNDKPDSTGAVVYFTSSAMDLVDGSITPHCNYQSGAKFPIGVSTITCTAQDSRGNHSSRSLQITITLTPS